MPERLLSVDAITEYLQSLFDSDELLTDIWIEGEVTETFTSRAGHVYFTLCGDESLLKSVMFRGAAIRQRYAPRIGESCAAHGSLSIYGKSGVYQLYVDVVQPAGLGAGALQFELLRQLLQAEGLFDPSRKRPIPLRPVKIGVVTSPDGAVWHDIRSVVERRNPFIELILSPAMVQGERAPSTLLAALQRLVDHQHIDVIIIARGGGSAADLSAFNDESLARAVFASPIPIVSAIGHETDGSLVDEVADVRAPTPSVAAELCAPHAIERFWQMRSQVQYQKRVLQRRTADAILDVDAMRSSLSDVGIQQPLQRADTQVQLHSQGLRNGIQVALDSFGSSLVRIPGLLNSHALRRIDSGELKLARHGATLQALDPVATLARGYANVTSIESGLPLKSVKQSAAGDQIGIHLYDGSMKATVGDVRPTQDDTEHSG